MQDIRLMGLASVFTRPRKRQAMKRLKLSDSDVRWIRKFSGRTGVRECARRFKVSAAYVSDIVKRKRRADVPDFN